MGIKIGKKYRIILAIIFTTLLFASLFSLNGFSQTFENRRDSQAQSEIAKSNPWHNWVRDQNHNRLDDKIDELIKTNDNEPVNIYINYLSPPNRHDIKKVEDIGINISYRANCVPTICAREVPVNIVQQLTTITNIAMIELQPFLVPALDVSARSVKARESTEYSPETAWELGYTGKRMVIAILDSGVDDRHEALTGKFVAGVDFTQDESLFVRRDGSYNPDDNDGHGTHVAGIAMGTGGDDGQYMGIAPSAKLVDVKVLNDWGLTPGDQILEGIDWCIRYKDEFDISILSISIGELFTGNDDGQGTHALAVNNASDHGLVVVVAAGNDGPNNNGYSSLAAADGAITVGAIDEQETVKRIDDEIADFSSRGRRASDGDADQVDELKPDVVAPGVSIMSARYSNTPAGLVTGYQALSGTSMACPHVAGLAALILEANPYLTPEKVKQTLRASAEARGSPTFKSIDPKYNEDYGWGIVDAYEAVRTALGEDNQQIHFLSHENFANVYNIVKIYGTATILHGELQEIEYKINDDDWQLADGTESWEFDWDTTTVDNGPYSVYVRSYDGIEHSSEFELKLNVTNIGAEITFPTNGSKVAGNVLIQGISFESDVTEVLIKIGDDYWEIVEPKGSGQFEFSLWEYSWNTKNVENGEYTLSVKAYNGNWESIPTSISVKVDNSESSSGGFLPGFDVVWVLVGIILLIIIGKRKDMSKRNI